MQFYVHEAETLKVDAGSKRLQRTSPDTPVYRKWKTC